MIVPGFITAYIDGKERKSYLAGCMNDGFEEYLKVHAADTRLRGVGTLEELYYGEICYFTFIAEKRKLEPLYKCVKDNNAWNCIFQQDKYRQEYWLEISPVNATKAKAIQRVKELCGCDNVVVFGDSLNDISMFQIAQQAYAVSNAMEELKSMATGIIGDNNSDGVAKWLERRILS